MTEVREIKMFYGSLSAVELRKKAAACDDRARAAEHDSDLHDAGNWKAQAIEFRRLAREKEFA